VLSCQWWQDNTCTETLSVEAAQYEQGMKYIQDMFDVFLQLPMKEIDTRTVDKFEGNNKLGLLGLLDQMRLGYIQGTQRSRAEGARKGWVSYLTNRGPTIFMN